MHQTERIYTTGGAARRIDVSEATMRRLADTCAIPSWRTATGARLYRESDLDEYARRRAATGVELR